MRTPKYKFRSNLTEKQMEADIASFFGWISEDAPFCLLDIDEQLTGADKKYFDSGFAFFMQFKVSHGLKSVSQVPVSGRANQSKLESVRQFRHEADLEDDPSLYFKLRSKAKHASDFQHNVLMTHANTGHSQAFYVAPLDIDRQNYPNRLFDSVNRYRASPFTYGRRKVYQDKWVSYIGHVPFLKNHVSIIPHERVDTDNHYYSYSTGGDDIAWHSGEEVSQINTRLSDLLVSEIRHSISERQIIPLNKLERLLRERFAEYGDIPGENVQDEMENSVNRIQKMARFILQQYRIRLVLLLANGDYVESIRQENIG